MNIVDLHANVSHFPKLERMKRSNIAHLTRSRDLIETKQILAACWSRNTLPTAMASKLELVVAAVTLFAYCIDAAMEVQLDRFEQLSGHHLINASGVRVRKYNRTTWALDGEADVYIDLTDAYSFYVGSAYSRLGNNQYNEYPLKLAKNKTCAVFNGPFKEYQQYFVESTNLPRVADDWLCPFPKGHYWVKDLAPEGGWIPPVVPEGYWRLTFDMMDTESEAVLVRLVAHMHFRRKLM